MSDKPNSTSESEGLGMVGVWWWGWADRGFKEGVMLESALYSMLYKGNYRRRPQNDQLCGQQGGAAWVGREKRGGDLPLANDDEKKPRQRWIWCSSGHLQYQCSERPPRYSGGQRSRNLSWSQTCSPEKPALRRSTVTTNQIYMVFIQQIWKSVEWKISIIVRKLVRIC